MGDRTLTLIKNFCIAYARKIYGKLPVLIFDAVSIIAAWAFAYALQANAQKTLNLDQFYSFSVSMFILFSLQICCYYFFKVYRGFWCFVSLSDVKHILYSVIVASALAIPLYYYTNLLDVVVLSALPVYVLTATAFLCGGRLFIRNKWSSHSRNQQRCSSKRVLIIGAGSAAESLLRDIKRSRDFILVALVDDDIRKKGLEIHGVRILNDISTLSQIVKELVVDLIFIAIPSACSSDMQRIFKYCELSNTPFRTLPGLLALVAGKIQVNALRKVSIEDLLGRDQVTLNWSNISTNICDKRILVTGGGGSIGSELCRQVMRQNPEKLLILDNCEYNLYKINHELKQQFEGATVELALISIVDSVAVEKIFDTFCPNVVFHAASYKHVPMLENQVRVAIQNNVIGAKVVAEASVAAGVEKFVYISTDKAVNPTNVMGATKRIAEIYCQNLNRYCDTQFITVRFGNVLGSVGSVVPLFKKQLEEGGPITITHPDIERYFMTISEACMLILQAMVNGSGGEIFVLDMGEPVKIQYLAEQMIRLAGKEPGVDVAIKYTGLRPGEKLFEELFYNLEQLVETNHEKLFKAKCCSIFQDEFMDKLQELISACSSYNVGQLYMLLESLVPEFRSQVRENTSEQENLVYKTLTKSVNNLLV